MYISVQHRRSLFPILTPHNYNARNPFSPVKNINIDWLLWTHYLATTIIRAISGNVSLAEKAGTSLVPHIRITSAPMPY